MRWYFPFLVVVLYPLTAFSQIRINEIYYDHPGADAGHEFIELINTGAVWESLAGFVLEFHDGASTGWKPIWQASPSEGIAAGALLVIGGGEVSPIPDRVIDLVLQNGPDAVRLVKDDVGVDRIGYGSLSDPQYYEGSAAPDVSEGWSLGRYPDGVDTDDNAVDFHRLEPSPGRYNRPRNDVALSLAPTTPESRIVQEGTQEVVEAWIVNRGLDALEARSVTVALSDSSRFFVGLLDSTTNLHAIPVQDSLEVSFTLMLAAGYHHLALVALMAGDDNPRNNAQDLLRRIGDPPLLISEVMSYPGRGCPEYVELFNAGTTPYRLAGHALRDAAHAPVATAETTVGPRDYTVVTGDAAALLECFPWLVIDSVVEVQGPWPSLNHSGSGAADSVIVLDHFRLPIDRVAYPPQPPATRGRSLERVDLYPGVRTHSWVLSTSDAGGSPGRGSRQAILDVPSPGAVSVVPNPFRLDADGDLFITIAARGQPTRSVVHLFDLSGRRLRQIGSSTELPFVFVWDGRDERGRPVTPGIYVVACELYALTTGKREVVKVVVACGREKR